MGMTHTLVSLLSRLKRIEQPTRLSVLWTIKERNPKTGMFEPKASKHNLFTGYGLTALASAIGGGYLPPNYIAISTTYVTGYAPGNVGDTTVQLSSDPTIAGDSQLVLSAGLAAQEIVTFTGSSGTSPVTFTLSAPLVNAHAIGDPAARQVNINDSMAQITDEAQYDPTDFPQQRMYRASGYSSGVGNYIMQFYFSGTMLTNVMLMTVGLTDQQSMTTLNANLHNAVVLGYNHTNTNDLEVDVSFTIINN